MIPKILIEQNLKCRDLQKRRSVKKNALKGTGIKFRIICNSSFSSLQHIHQLQREGLSEEERFEREKAERQRIAELLAEREKLLSRWARFVF